jgi:glycosyltransferase involved in cell wall biosynthesis
MSHTCVVTADGSGGCQRTVLEAMACNIPVIAMSDSDKTTEYIKECGVGSIVETTPEAIRNAVDAWKGKKVDTRSFIKDNYSEEIYAKKLCDGINSIIQKKGA